MQVLLKSDSFYYPSIGEENIQESSLEQKTIDCIDRLTACIHAATGNAAAINTNNLLLPFFEKKDKEHYDKVLTTDDGSYQKFIGKYQGSSKIANSHLTALEVEIRKYKQEKYLLEVMQDAINKRQQQAEQFLSNLKPYAKEPCTVFNLDEKLKNVQDLMGKSVILKELVLRNTEVLNRLYKDSNYQTFKNGDFLKNEALKYCNATYQEWDQLQSIAKNLKQEKDSHLEELKKEIDDKSKVKKLSSVPTKIEELENTLKQLKQEKATITQQWNATEKRLNEIKSLIDGQTSYWNLTAPSKDDQITLFSPLDVNSLEEHLKTIVVLKETILNDYESVKETSNANYAEHLYQKNTCAMKSWSESYNSRKKIIEERTATLQKSIESWQLDISMINIALSQLDKAKEELETKLKERKSLTEVPKSGYLLNFKFWGHHSN